MARPVQRRTTMSRDRVCSQIHALFGRSPRPPIFAARIRGYQLLKEIGRGTRATVYLARSQERRPRLVVIKLAMEHAGGQSGRRFRREAVCASFVKHVNVVQVYKIIQRRSVDAIVMEYVPGKTLDRVIPKRGLPLGMCLTYALQMARALAAVHSEGMMHRDLKPANFVVSGRLIKLLDFGLAKFTTIGLQLSPGNNPNDLETRDGTILGTPSYMSPEQVRGRSITQRSDVFSFGAVLYEMLTGHRAFEEKSAIETMSAILQKTPRRLPNQIPAPISSLVERCLAKEQRRRYKNGQVLLKNLERLIANRS